MACARTWDHNAVSKTFVVWRFRAPVSWHWLEINIVFKTHYLIHVFWFIYFFLDVGYTFLILHFFASLLLWCINHVLGWFSLNKQGLLVKIEPGFIHSTSSVPPKKTTNHIDIPNWTQSSTARSRIHFNSCCSSGDYPTDLYLPNCQFTWPGILRKQEVMK